MHTCRPVTVMMSHTGFFPSLLGPKFPLPISQMVPQFLPFLLLSVGAAPFPAHMETVRRVELFTKKLACVQPLLSLAYVSLISK